MKLLDVEYERVHLERAPLVLILCQLRFNDHPALGQRATAEAILERLKPQYVEVVNQDVTEAVFHLDAPGVAVQQQTAQSFILKSPGSPWWVMLSPSIATLVGTNYSERQDFLDRITALREALTEQAQVSAVERVGVRYVARVADADFLANLDTYVRTDVLGGTHLPLAGETQINQTVSDTVIQQGSTVARVRAGLMPAGATPDPAIPPLDRSSWVFDIDTFNGDYRHADESVEGTAADLARNQYQLFRWLVTDEFLRYFGGDI